MDKEEMQIKQQQQQQKKVVKEHGRKGRDKDKLPDQTIQEGKRKKEKQKEQGKNTKTAL